MSFNVQSDTQFTSELINFLAKKENEVNVPDGINWGDYLYWDGHQYAVGDQNITLGAFAGENFQNEAAVALGTYAGNYSQGTTAIAIGAGAGQTQQGFGCIAIGLNAGGDIQGIYGEGCCSVAVGVSAGQTQQGFFGVAMGAGAGGRNQSPGSIAIGYLAGSSNQGGVGDQYSCCGTAIGVYAGATNQGSNAQAIGMASGSIDQGAEAISIGLYSGYYSQGAYAIAIGSGAGSTNQGSTAIAIGLNAGEYAQGSDAIAIGNGAGVNEQAYQSIAINATGSVMDNPVPRTCRIAPVRDLNPSETSFVEPYGMSYIPSTAEMVFNSNPQIYRSFGQGNELLLSDYNTTHYYVWDNVEAPLQYIDIPTTMVENSVYEVTFNTSGSFVSNNDMLLFPNYVGGGLYYTNYMNRSGTGVVSLQASNNNQGGFSFDLVAGSNGYDPIGKITIFNNRSAKKVRVEVGDTCAITTGAGYWLTNTTSPSGGPIASLYDTTTQWVNVGRLQFGGPSFTNVVVTVRRII